MLREAGGGPNGVEGADRRQRVIILIATGSELQLAMGAAEVLEREGIPTRVVCLPCWELFEAQDQAYRDAVLPPAVRARVGVEVGASLGWERWVGDRGRDHRPGSLRCIGAGPVDLREVRVHRGARRGHRPRGPEGEVRGPIPTLEPRAICLRSAPGASPVSPVRPVSTEPPIRCASHSDLTTAEPTSSGCC